MLVHLLRSRRGLASSSAAASVNRFLKTAPRPAPEPRQCPSNLQLLDPQVLEPEQPFQYELASRLVKEDFTLPMYYGPFAPGGLGGEPFPEPVHLAPHVFQTEIRPDIMARVVRWQRNMWQQGTHKTKGKGEVSGRGGKPYRQKGTGLARQGNVRNPHFRGGGVAFGQQVRSHAHKMNRRERRFGLRSALAARFQESQLFVCSSLDPFAEAEADEMFQVEQDISQHPLAKQVQLSPPLVQRANSGFRRQHAELSLKSLAQEQRTDHIADLLEDFCEKLDITKVLVLDTEPRQDVIEAIKKVQSVHIDYQCESECNVYEVLHKRQVLISKPALVSLEHRLNELAIRQAKWARKGFVEFLANPEVERVRVPGRLRNRATKDQAEKIKTKLANSKPLSAELVSKFDARHAQGHCVICDSAQHHSDSCVSPGSAALWSEAETYFASKK